MKPVMRFISIAGFLFGAMAQAKIYVNEAERAEMMKAARVWSDPGVVSNKNTLQGPGKKFVLHQLVKCTFYDSYYTRMEGTGLTAKFWCVQDGKNPDGDEIKVKYNDKNKNGEVFAEVVSSRLLWALGFYADKAYPIRVDCVNCPDEPWTFLNKLDTYKKFENRTSGVGAENRERAAEYILAAQQRRARLNELSLAKMGRPHARHYEVALSEGKFDGIAIHTNGVAKASVNLKELETITEEAGGSSKAQVDALKLLLAFVKHGDNKADNQRLVCPNEHVIKGPDNMPAGCAHPYLVMQDLGATFGNGATPLLLGLDITTGVLPVGITTEKSKLAFEQWRDTPLWKNAGKCVALLRDNLRGSMQDPQISEAGRQFLADLLVQLTDQQIADMFIAARADERRGFQAAEIKTWVELFKAKRAEILNVRCPQ